MITTTMREVRDYDRADRDWYVENPWCVDLLLEREVFKGLTVDPCAGQATIPLRCHEYGVDCLAMDIEPQHLMVAQRNFLEWPGDLVVDNIIFNPPYKNDQAEIFIRKALGHARRKVAALVQEKFPYSEGRHLFFQRDHPPTQIYFFSSRPSMPPGEELRRGAVKACGGKVNYIWIVWERGAAPRAPQWLIKPGALERELLRSGANRD